MSDDIKIIPEQVAPQTKVNKPKRPSKIFTEYYGSLILLLLALLVGAGFFVIKPQIDEYKDMRAYTESLRQETNNENTYLAGLKRSVAAAQTIAPGVLEKVDKALPHHFRIPEMLVHMGNAANAANVEIGSISFDAPSGVISKGLQEVNVTMTLKADGYTSLKKFLHELEVSLRIIDVQTITVSGFGTDSASFSLQMTAYYYADPAINKP
ncbi:MAG: type 4a pilus biogenesis protein PilO [Patescibacteria group bacterium]